MSKKSNVVTVRLTDEQLKVFTDWKEKVEGELGIEVPLGAVIRRALDGAIQMYNQHRDNEVQVEINPDERTARTQGAYAYISDYKEGK